MRATACHGVCLAVLTAVPALSAGAAREQCASRVAPPAWIVFFGDGEDVAHVRDLPRGVGQEVALELGGDVAVGYAYKRFHILWLNVWTWSGRHVLYRGDEYWEIPPETWQGLLGKAESEKLGKPLLYRFPPGLMVVCGLVVLACVWGRVFPSEAKRARKLLADPRYQAALQMLIRPAASPGSPSGSEGGGEGPAGAAFGRAVQHLRDAGIPTEEAQKNLQLVLRVLEADAQRSARAEAAT